MKKCAFLTMDNPGDFVIYDSLLVEPLTRFGWDVDTISWKKRNVCWKDYHCVIVRSTWDYQNDPDLFLTVLDTINDQTRLENNLELINWNINKNYLAELEKKKIAIVPTLWPDAFDANLIKNSFNRFNAEEIILKPRISANADNTFRLTYNDLYISKNNLADVFRNRPFLIQPFLKNIITEGEYSLFFFGGEYSHTILKTPKTNDFRVQEEHGGILKPVTPSKELLKTAWQSIDVLHRKPLYARVDFVRDEHEQYLLMEMELIEPSLYFNMDPDSPIRFAKVFDKWMNSGQ